MNDSENTCFSVLVGIDWADTKHDFCLQATGSALREFGTFSHQAGHIDDWVRNLHSRYGGKIAIGLELTKGPLVYALQKYDFLVLFPINPATLAKYRQAFKPSRAKDDPTDAELALDLLQRHRERFQPLEPQSPTMRALLTFVESRRELVGDKTRFTNRLTNTLKQYYPQVLDWFEHHDTIIFCDFITRWPTLEKAQRAHATTLEKFFKNHNARRVSLIEDRLVAIRVAKPLTLDVAIIAPHLLQTLVLIEQIKIALKAIERFDDAIARLAPTLPDFELFSALPGAGPTLAPRLLVAFGEQRERFASANEMQQYVGVAPVTERSGKKSWVHWRWQCPTFVRQTFVEWAGQTINKSAWAGAYYRQQRAKGSSYQAAVRALAFKWLRVIFRCWQTRVPYDEARYIARLKAKGSALVGAIELAA
jgi:transposase